MTLTNQLLYRPAEDSGETDSREELQRLYNQLEDWRLAEEKRLVTTARNQKTLKSGRAKLVSEEALKLAQLAAKRDKNTEVHKHEVIRNIIIKAGQPRSWFNTSGNLLQLETPATQRAKGFADVYMRLISDGNDEVNGPDADERIPTLHAVAELVRFLNTNTIKNNLSVRTTKGDFTS